jgi:hypothetical protein
MNQIFAPYIHKFMVIYRDDILMYGKDPEESDKDKSSLERAKPREHEVSATVSGPDE